MKIIQLTLKDCKLYYKYSKNEKLIPRRTRKSRKVRIKNLKIGTI